jgi:hypothetical protein
VGMRVFRHTLNLMISTLWRREKHDARRGVVIESASSTDHRHYRVSTIGEHVAARRFQGSENRNLKIFGTLQKHFYLRVDTCISKRDVALG